jgi:probable F420-dependent oxidoreductase
MSEKKAFRFGVNCIGSASREQWGTTARKAEDLGYSTLSVGDHLWTDLAPLSSLMAAADATTVLRVGSLVFANDFRHPVLLARECATIDVLSNGRLELGLGTGWEQDDYERIGIPLQAPRERVSRFEEAVQLLKRLFCEDGVTFSGKYYQVTNSTIAPKPVQQPYPPILIGGGGQRMLSIAARHAQIVSVNVTTTADGALDWRSATSDAVSQKIDWVRQCAGGRFDELELHILLSTAVVTDKPREAAEAFAKDWNIDPNQLTVAEMLQSPCFLFGSLAEIVDLLQARRERFGISYFTLFGEDRMESFGPVARRLAGQ